MSSWKISWVTSLVHLFLAIEFQTLLQEEVLFLLVEAESSVILEKLEQGLNEGLKAAVHEEEEQFGHGGLKLEWTGLEVMLLEPKLLERLDEFELEESFVLELTTGMFIGAEVAMMLSLSPLVSLLILLAASTSRDCFRGCGFPPHRWHYSTSTSCVVVDSSRDVERIKCLRPPRLALLHVADHPIMTAWPNPSSQFWKSSFLAHEDAD